MGDIVISTLGVATDLKTGRVMPVNNPLEHPVGSNISANDPDLRVKESLNRPSNVTALDKAMGWVKKNPIPALAVAGVLAFLASKR